METVNGIEEFVQYVVTGLADDPGRASVSSSKEGDRHVIRVKVAPDDMARLLGRSGNTVSAVRNLAVAAGARHGVEVGVEVHD